jgi:hypothetical protein
MESSAGESRRTGDTSIIPVLGDRSSEKRNEVRLGNRFDTGRVSGSHACAGEAGRGFAVVASAVKELSNKTLRRCRNKIRRPTICLQQSNQVVAGAEAL